MHLALGFDAHRGGYPEASQVYDQCQFVSTKTVDLAVAVSAGLKTLVEKMESAGMVRSNRVTWGLNVAQSWWSLSAQQRMVYGTLVAHYGAKQWQFRHTWQVSRYEVSETSPRKI
jgi:hypothetical protein